jgi:hypothetical protein
MDVYDDDDDYYYYYCYNCYHQATTVKPETAIAVVELLMMGVRKPETC